MASKLRVTRDVSLGLVNDCFYIWRHGADVSRNVHPSWRQAVLLKQALPIATQEKPDEFLRTLGIRRVLRDGDGIVALGLIADGKLSIGIFASAVSVQ